MFLSLRKLSEMTGKSKETIRARLRDAKVFHKGFGGNLTYSSKPALEAIYHESKGAEHEVSRERRCRSGQG